MVGQSVTVSRTCTVWYLAGASRSSLVLAAWSRRVGRVGD